MHKLPSLSSLRTFEAAARLGSFSLASDELSVTASAVSHQVKLLEEYTGVQLFRRIHRSVVLTDVGRRYANEIAFAFEHMATATQNIAKADKSDILSIHSSPSFATQWLMPRLSRFSTIQPDIDVRLHAAHSGVDMVPEFDIDIRYGTKLSSASTVSVFLPEEVIVPMCAPALIGGPKPNLKLNLKRGLRFDRSFMSIGAAVDGLGVCLESLLLVQREIEMKQLVMPFGPDSLTLLGHNVAYLTSTADLPKIKAFQNWLFSELAHTEQWKQRVIRVVQDRHIKS